MDGLRNKEWKKGFFSFTLLLHDNLGNIAAPILDSASECVSLDCKLRKNEARLAKQFPTKNIHIKKDIWYHFAEAGRTYVCSSGYCLHDQHKMVGIPLDL
jgi:hypothetical protein